MVPELARPMAALDERTGALLADIEAMSPEQQRFRQDDESWSPVMVLHHLALYESLVAARIGRREGGRRRRRRLRQKLLYPVVKLILRSGYRVRVPEGGSRALPDPELDFGGVRAFWGEARAELRAALEGVSVAELGEESYRHPVAGPLDFREGLQTMVDHFDHHLRQIGRIRQAPGFPA